jgi:hypothetical protein
MENRPDQASTRYSRPSKHPRRGAGKVYPKLQSKENEYSGYSERRGAQNLGPSKKEILRAAQQDK